MYILKIHLFERFLSLKLIVHNTIGKNRRRVTRKSRPQIAIGVFKTFAFRFARCFPEIVDCWPGFFRSDLKRGDGVKNNQKNYGATSADSCRCNYHFSNLCTFNLLYQSRISQSVSYTQTLGTKQEHKNLWTITSFRTFPSILNHTSVFLRFQRCRRRRVNAKRQLPPKSTWQELAEDIVLT